MSIIQEALNKAQKKNIARETALPVTLPTETVKILKAAEKKDEPKPQVRSVFYTALVLAVLAVFASRYFLNTTAKNAALIQRHENTVVSPKAQEASASVTKSTFEDTKLFEFPKQFLSGQDEFTLSGIMHLDDGPRAIINNATLAEGDKVGDATVIKIADDGVVLKRRDSEITLRLK